MRRRRHGLQFIRRNRWSGCILPVCDNVERAKKSGVAYIAQPGGSIRDDNVIDTCNKYGIVMSFTGIRLFHH